MEFLIVMPRYTPRIDGYYDFPLGVMYIASSLKQAGFSVHCLNLQNRSGEIKDILKECIINKKIDVLCVGDITSYYNNIKEILTLAREIKPDITTIVGGGMVSSEPELMLNALQFDFGVIGEGEETIVELAQALTQKQLKEFRSIHGIIYRENKEIVLTSPRKAIENIDLIPWPDRESFGVEEYLNLQRPSDIYVRSIMDYPRALSISASRSCPFNCSFCYHPTGQKYRQRSLDAIFKEIDYLIEKYKVNIINVVDELLANDVERLYEFCNRIASYNIFWSAQLRVDKVNQGVLNMMKRSGCFCISYGLKSANNHVLKSMKKHITVEQINKALELTHQAGITLQGGMIVGDVEDTWATAMQSLQWAIDHKPFRINVNRIISYPGSELYQEALRRGKIHDRLQYIETECPPVNVTKMTDEEYNRFFKKVDIEYHANIIIPKVRRFEKQGHDTYGREKYLIEVQCPYCGQIVTYNNMGVETPTAERIFFCKHCFYRYDLPLYLYFKEIPEITQYIASLIKRVGTESRVALWGASNSTKHIIDHSSLLKDSLVCIFDNDPQKQGLDLDGSKILRLPKHPDDVKQLVDMIIISSKNHEMAIYEQIAHLQEYGIKISGLYNESIKMRC